MPGHQQYLLTIPPTHTQVFLLKYHYKTTHNGKIFKEADFLNGWNLNLLPKEDHIAHPLRSTSPLSSSLPEGSIKEGPDLCGTQNPSTGSLVSIVGPGLNAGNSIARP